MAVLENKIALVTGASHSIGRAIAVAFAQEGADVVIAARNEKELNNTAKKIEALGRKALVVITDIRSETQIDNLFRQTMSAFGRLDILVNNAGIFNGGPIDKIPTEVWDDVISTNLRGAFLCTRQAFAIMKKQGGGRIINIGSISASRVRKFNAPYSSAKFALSGLTQSTALEGREFNITCGILHPGEVERDTRPQTNKQMPEPPSMKPEEIAAAAVYMACQPPNINVLELIQLPVDQPYLGRG